MKKIGTLFHQTSKRVKAAIMGTAVVGILLLFIGLGILLPNKNPHKTAPQASILPSNSLPKTGLSIIFNPPLTSSVILEIDNSSGIKIKTYTLAKATSGASPNIIANSKGVKYNVALDEGVYSLKISSSNNGFTLFTETVTVPKHELKTERISIM